MDRQLESAQVRILQIVTVRLGYDGLSSYVLRYAAAMDRARIKMDILAINEPPEEIRRALDKLGVGLNVIKGRLKNPVGYMRRLAQLVRKNRYDVVHVHGNSCTLAVDLMGAYLGGAKVRIAHSHNTSCRFRIAHRALRPAFDRLYTHALACGERAGDWLFGRRPFKVLPVAVEPEKYAFDPALRAKYRAELGAGDELLIGSVAHFAPHKNHGFLLEIFAAYHKVDPAARLVLVGDGNLRSEIEAAVNRLGIAGAVDILGLRTDVCSLEQAFDVMLLPSLFEGFPTVLLEWQCAGLHALVSDTVTPEAALTDMVGFLPITQGCAPWVDALARIKAGDRAEDSRRGIRAVRDGGFDIASNARRLREIYLRSLK